MNIFYLDGNPRIAAQNACNSHSVKMVSETCQILCTAFDLQSYLTPPKRMTHDQHPCCLWARYSKETFDWLFKYAVEINREYEYRYGNIHKDKACIEWIRKNKTQLWFYNDGFTEPPTAIPEDCWLTNPLDSYRLCYATHKRRLLKYYKRVPPTWLDLEFEYFPEKDGYRLPEHKDWSNK